MAHSGDEDFLQRLFERLDPLEFAENWAHAPPRSDFDLNPQFRPGTVQALKRAAVLAPIVRRPEGLTLLLTLRADTMPTHAGQVAFPGGRIQAEDAGPVAAALRETEEEIGLAARFVHPLGTFEPYETVSGFSIAPVVALVEPGFSMALDPREVADVFETPIAFLFNPANHQLQRRVWQGGERSYYVMPWLDRYIWGATAGMIKALYDRLYGPPP
jgi:8-oxo-dGTP pyrophosphatase MutT (NUDIX family)